MRIALISEYNIFTTIGGTEYYVDALLKGLLSEGCELILITKGKQENEIVEKVVVEKSGEYTAYFLPAEAYNREEIRQEKVSSSWPLMKPILDHFKPEVIHVHTATTFFNVRHLEQCTQTFRNLFFTSHVPGHFCSKGDLIKANKHPCNGKIGNPCLPCLFTKSLKGGISSLIHQHHLKPLQALELLKELNIKIICTAAWQKEQLRTNGYPEKKLSVIKQPLITSHYQKVLQKETIRKFTIGYLGRLSPEKGSTLLFQIIEKFSSYSDVQFLLGIPENSDGVERQKLERVIEKAKESGPEIKVTKGIHAGNKETFFEQVDCLLIPSFCVETGPIVLLESIFYQKIVVAPNVGGPAEYSKEFPGTVLNYQWNNAEEAANIINELKKGRDTKRADYSAALKRREKDFIEDHLSLYTSALPKLKQQTG